MAYYERTRNVLRSLVLNGRKQSVHPISLNFDERANWPKRPQIGHLLSVIDAIQKQPLDASGAARAAWLLDWVRTGMQCLEIKETADLLMAIRHDASGQKSKDEFPESLAA
jgi:hypothetical protein